MLSDEIKQAIFAETCKCKQKPHACLDAMRVVTEHHGWISDEHIKELAVCLEMTPEEVDSCATFYNHIYRKTVGRHLIHVCNSVCCWITGYERMLDHLTRRLGISLGQTTPDGRFTLLPIQCLGACHEAPAMMVDRELFTNLDEQRINEILERYP
jgi:NADH-quinone oxidoreductase subunit E